MLFICEGFGSESGKEEGSRWHRLASVARFFSWRSHAPRELRDAIESYESGRLFETLASATVALESRDGEPFRDEIYLVRGLALADLGWRELAAQSFTVVLDTEPASPYYPLALLELIEAYHREDRLEAVSEAYDRYVEKPWKASDRKALLVRNRLLAYGELRDGGERYATEEKELLSQRSRLAEKLSQRKERPSERLVYLAGLDFFRAGHYDASLAALERIGITSFYFPYALYTTAQDFHAVGQAKRARSQIERLLELPLSSPEEQRLTERAGLLRAQLYFESGSADQALAAAGTVQGDGLYALQARLFRGEICLAIEKPSLAVAYYRDLGERTSEATLDAERSLGLGAAYSALGDFHSAAEALQRATESVARARERIEASDLGRRVEELRSLAEIEAAAHLRAASERRRRLAAGIRRVLDFKGPLNVGKLTRIVFASHRNTIVGEPVYDVQMLAEAERASGWEAPAGEGLWLDYLKSPLRSQVTDALGAMGALDGARDPATEPALRTLDAALKWLEGRFPRPTSENAHDVAQAAVVLSAAVSEASSGRVPVAALDLEAPLAAQVEDYRKRLTADRAPRGGSNEVPVDPAVLAAAAGTTRRAVSESVTYGLRQIVRERGDRLRHLEYELTSALSQTLAHERGALAPSEISP